VRGDWRGLRELFIEQLARGTGEVRVGRVEEILVRWGKATGVRLESGEELGATHVIGAMPLSELAPLVPVKSRKRIDQCLQGLRVGAYRYCLNLVVDEAGVPEGMSSPVLLVVDPSQPLQGDNALAFYLSEPDDEARVVISVSAICPVPAEDESLDNHLADLRVRIRERMEMVMPFMAEHVLVAHAPAEATPPEGIDVSLGHQFPIAPEPLWSSTLDAALGVSAVPYAVGVKHLTVASEQVLPQLGVEGSFTTGWCAARIVCDALGKKRDYLKDEVLASSS
jgi:hypothetical protein